MKPTIVAHETQAQRRRNWLIGALLIFSAWTLVGLLGLSKMLTLAALGKETLRGDFFKETAESVWLWAAFTPGILALARRFPIVWGTLAPRLLLHLACALCFHLADLGIDALLLSLLSVPIQLPQRLLGELWLNVFSYFATVGCGHALAYYSLYHERREAAARLAEDLARTQLQVLRTQLQPHFLFNALNTVSALIRDRQNKNAMEVVASIGELLRMVLRSGEAHEIPLGKELDLVRLYLSIEEVRFQDRLTIEEEIAPATLSAKVPALLLQVLVENAIRHGVVAHPGPARIRICSKVVNGRLSLLVENTGPPPHEGGKEGEGIGLCNTRARLAHLYGAKSSLELRGSGSETQALVYLPMEMTDAA